MNSNLLPPQQEPRIIGIMLVRNEENFLPWALNNIIDFCDEIILVDNMSSDSTCRIIDDFARFHRKIHSHRIHNAMKSHALIAKYANTNTWIFGVDGDEVYDPIGLINIRNNIKTNKYKNYWRINGCTLHCIYIDVEGKTADGYVSPPSKGCTKLFNFDALLSWDELEQERLHGQNARFKEGRSHDDVLDLMNNVSWDEADFRCLHLCFFPRSKIEKPSNIGRLNPAQINEINKLNRFKSRVLSLLGIKNFGARRERILNYKNRKYMKGKIQYKNDIRAFGPPPKGIFDKNY